ncbi:MAG: two-component system response regulator NarL [Thiohalomonadaceae bacterium]
MKECRTVITIDDHPLFRKGVADLLGMQPGLCLVGEAASGAEGVELAKRVNPDIILLDMNLPGMDGIATLKCLKDADLDARVVMLTVSDSEDNIIAALRGGADGYLLKDMEPEDILERLLLVAEGRTVISERVTELLAQALREEVRPRSVAEAGLTVREEEILRLIALGQSNKLIARQLDISEGTVKVHVKHLLKKLNLRSRIEAALWMLKQAPE